MWSLYRFGTQESSGVIVPVRSPPLKSDLGYVNKNAVPVLNGCRSTDK